MDSFDIIVIGSGAGAHVASRALKEGLEVALVDHGPIGGTCLNTGCIPSKMLIYPADVIRAVQDAAAIGVTCRVIDIDFPAIMERMRSLVDGEREHLEVTMRTREGLTLFTETARFVGDRTLKVGDETITAPKIVIASGARPLVPPVKGLQESGYLDNASVLRLQRLPKSMVVIGAGYIGCEYGNFFSALGAEVTIIGRNRAILQREEPEVCAVVKKALSRYMDVRTNHEVLEVRLEGDLKIVTARNHDDGKTYEFRGEEILLAAGRRSNADLLNPGATGVETDERGWIKVNEYLETTAPGIWALGDILGRHMFRHTANYEAEVVAHNIFGEEKQEADYHAVPHAVFTYPEVGAVGMTEAEALAEGYKILVGRARYMDVARGAAMRAEDGFVKAVVDEETGRVLGCSVTGPEAASLVQQVVYLMNTDYGDLIPVIRSQIIHPTLSEAVVRAFSNLKQPEPVQETRP